MVQSLDMLSPFPELTFLQNKTVVVTGGAGFIGSHLCEQLLALNAKVIAIDNFITGNQKNIEFLQSNPNFKFIQADVTQPPETYLQNIVEIDAILHFASPASPPKYQAKPVETYLVNSLGTHLLLQFLLKNFSKSRFLFASTSEIYGDPAEHPQKESYWGNVNPNGVRSCYDEAKRLGESICGVHQRDLGMDVRIVRIFNTYGPRIDLSDGRVIPDFIQQSFSGQPLTVYGDGSQTRSFCYVDDLVEGILRLASSSQGNGKTVNLGNPTEFTVLDAAKIVKEISGTQSEITFTALPKDDPTRRKPDISFAQQLLGWEPQVAFREGLQKTIASFQK